MLSAHGKNVTNSTKKGQEGLFLLLGIHLGDHLSEPISHIVDVMFLFMFELSPSIFWAQRSLFPETVF